MTKAEGNRFKIAYVTQGFPVPSKWLLDPKSTSDFLDLLGVLCNPRGQALDRMAYLSRSNLPLAISMRIDGDLSLCIPLPCKNCLAFPISVLRARLGQLVRFKEASAALSGLCNDGDTLGQTEKEWLIWYG